MRLSAPILLCAVGSVSAALLKTGAYKFPAADEKACKEGKFLPGCDHDKFARYVLLFCAGTGEGDSSIKHLADPYMTGLKARRGAAAKESPKEDGMAKWMRDYIEQESMSTCPLMAAVQTGAPTSPCEYKVATADGTLKKWDAKTITG